MRSIFGPSLNKALFSRSLCTSPSNPIKIAYWETPSSSSPEKVTTLLADYPFSLRLRVAWGDQDSFGHVNNVKFHNYVESARVAHMQHLAESRQLAPFMNNKEIGPILGSTSVRFKRPLTYPDHITVARRTKNIRKSSWTESFVIVSDKLAEVVFEGEARIVTVDYRTLKKVPLPDVIVQALQDEGCSDVNLSLDY